jgi:gamma-glutamyltranspeptidase/glutathione hydrolase
VWQGGAVATRDPEFTTRPQLAGTFGMVASTHWLASAAGMAALEEGGNAFDAAVAAGLVLGVVEPHMNGPGGEVPVIAADAASGEVVVLDGQGPAPAAATVTAFGELGLSLIPGTGLLAACVPAAFGTWMLLARRGRLPLRELMSYAIGYASGGHPLAGGASAAIAAMAGVFRQHWPSSAEVYLRGSEPPAPGSRWANPDLARTYQRILAEAEAAGPGREAQLEAAHRAFYTGFVAEAIAGYLAGAKVADGTGEPHRALLTADDLARWQPSEEAPLRYPYRGLTVCKTGPWGQGPVFAQQLALLAGFDLPALAPEEYVHTVVECAKLAFADREAWYGDPRFTKVPLADLLSPEYADRRRRLVAGTASLELRPGDPGGARPRLPGFAARAPRRGGWPGDPGLVGRGDTCHVDAADRFGNLVSATPSGGWLQSSPVIPGLGFCLGTRAQMFTLTPGLPNTLEPGKRPRTTLSPTLVLAGSEPWLAFGTPGGDQQDQWALQCFLGHLHFGRNLQAAIDAPAFHTRHFPSSFFPRESHPGAVEVEGRLGRRVVAGLRRRGHRVTVRPGWSLGRVSAVARAGGLLYAAASPRGMQGYAAGR